MVEEACRDQGSGVRVYPSSGHVVKFDPKKVLVRSWGPTVGRTSLLATQGISGGGSNSRCSGAREQSAPAASRELQGPEEERGRGRKRGTCRKREAEKERVSGARSPVAVF